MTYYSLTQDPNQTFTIEINGETTTIALRWIPNINSWVAGIVGVARGVRVVPFLPIFTQYGWPNIYFVSFGGDEITEDLSKVNIVVSTEEEVEASTDNIVTIEPAGAMRLR